MQSTTEEPVPRTHLTHPVLSGSALRTKRRDLALDVIRLGCALATVAGTAGTTTTRDVAVWHLVAVVAAAAAVLAGLRPGVVVPTAALTWGTLGFWVASTVLWHDVPGAGSALGVLVLLEAAVRYGLRGALVSGSVVTVTALLLPQVDATGQTAEAWRTLVVVGLLLLPAVWLRAGTERAASRAEQVELAVGDALAALPVGVVVLHADGSVLHTNASLARLVGDGDPRDRLRDLAQDELQEHALEAVLAGAGPERLELATASGRTVSLGSSRTREGHVVVHAEDVTEAHRERARLHELASVDVLTGVSSRAAGEQALELARGRMALLFVDLDGVKQLNDRHGHAIGDAVLAATGGRLRGLLREGDLAVRWGGDEFVLLVGVGSVAESHAVADRVVTAVRAPVRLADGRLVEVTASVGLATTTDGTAGLVARADAAMYDAKRAGGDRFVPDGHDLSRSA